MNKYIHSGRLFVLIVVYISGVCLEGQYRGLRWNGKCPRVNEAHLGRL